MKKILENIFFSCEFISVKEDQNKFFFEKKEDRSQEYYLVDFIEGDMVKNYLEGASMNEILKLFNEQKTQKRDIEKNTSLIVCLKVEDIKNDMNGFRNDILKIEENEYWFKKYLIVYSDSSLSSVPDTDCVSYFNSMLIEQDAFKTYKDDIYLNEKYLLAIQIFLKIPFINVPVSNYVDYKSIEQLLTAALTLTELDLLQKLRLSDDIYEVAFWEKIQSNSLITADTTEVVNDFLKRFKLHA